MRHTRSLARAHGARALLACGLIVATTLPALADDEPQPAAESEQPLRVTMADEIVSIATRRGTKDFDVPYSTSVRDGERSRDTELRRTFPDALLGMPSVMVQRTAYGQASPFIRGFTGYHTVLLIDGVRLNNSNFRSGPNQYWATIDPFSVGRVEVVRGPASVLYGSDAVGGVVNALPRPNISFEPGTHVHGRNFTRIASAEKSWTNRTEFHGNVDDVSFSGGGTYRSYGDLKAGGNEGRQRETGYRDTAGDLRLDLRTNDSTTWTFAIQHVDQDDVPRTHQTVDGIEFAGTTVGSELRRSLDQTRDLLYARWTDTNPGWGFADRAQVTLSWQQQREQRTRDRDGGRRDVQGVDVRTFGLQAQFEKRTDVGDFTYGLELWHDDVDSFRNNFTNGVLDLALIQGPVADDATYDTFALFVQDEVKFGETIVTAGLRLTHADADADRVDNPFVGGSDPRTPGNIIGVSEDWTNVVGSLRAVHPLSERTNVFGGISQAFRAPNLSDLTRLDATSGSETPNPGLDPEDFITYEIGAKTRGDGWGVQTSIWWNDIDGLIVASPTGRTLDGSPEVRKDNIGDGWASGVELEGHVDLNEDWTLIGQASWMDGEVDQLTTNNRKVMKPLSRMKPLSGSVTVTYAPGDGGLVFWATGRVSDRQDELALRDRTDTSRIPPDGTPRYAVLHVGLRAKISDNATLALVVENVANANYRIHGSGVNEPGRNAVLALELGF